MNSYEHANWRRPLKRSMTSSSPWCHPERPGSPTTGLSSLGWGSEGSAVVPLPAKHRSQFRDLAAVLCPLLALALSTALGQVPASEKPTHTGSRAEAVQYLYPEQVTVPAGKATPVALHFRIKDGLHINSNKPRDEFLIPTVLTIPEASDVRLAGAEYPAGKEFELPVEPGTKLIVYTGEFTIEARLVAQPGDHMVEAKLRYQACDANACLPPKTITVPIDVIGK